MLQAEFQELKRLWSVNINERDEIIGKMRENLISRNGGASNYDFRYTCNRTVDINSIRAPEDLFAIDGDMRPRGL